MRDHIRLFGKNDKQRVKRTFDDYAPELIRYLSARIGNSEEARDLAQEAYLRLTRILDKDVVDNPEAYVFRIAANLATEFNLRKKERNARSVDIDELDDTRSEFSDDSFQRQMAAREAVRQLKVVLSELPPLYRSVLLLRKRDGLSHAEIAKELNISKSTVHTYLTRAVAKCRQQLTE